MKSLLLLAAIMSITALSALAADATFDRTLTFSGAPTVSISTGAGHIHVTPGTDNQLHVSGHVRANSGWFEPDPEGRVKRIAANPPITQTGTIVTIGKDHDDPELYRNITIDYDVTVPRTTALSASTGSGEMQISGIEGKVSATTGSGGIQANDLGPNARLSTGSGSIDAQNVHGGASAQTGSGSVQLGLSAAGDVKATTGSGSIHIAGVTGGVQARAGSGSIEIAGNPTAEWRLDSGSGGIQLRVGNAAHFTLYADTGSGNVQVSQPILMQGSLNKHHVSGTVNGGGPSIRASTGSGGITIF